MGYVRIYEIWSLQNSTIIKSEFQRNGINFTIDFENSLQLGNAYMLGVSGAILKVVEEQKAEALVLLEKLGFIVPSDHEVTSSGFIEKINHFTEKIPFISNLDSINRMMISIIFLFISLFIILGTVVMYYDL